MIEPISNMKMLAEMQNLKLGASGAPASTQTNVDFKKLFTDTINKTNEANLHASNLSKKFVMGEEGLTAAEVMQANYNAEIAMEATKQVRNKLLEHYKEILNTQL